MSDFESRVENLMHRSGTVIILGHKYLEVTQHLIHPKDQAQAVFSAARIDELPIPDTLTIDCRLLFSHALPGWDERGVTPAELERWKGSLLNGIVLKPSEVPGLKPEDLEEPSIELVTLGHTNDLVLLVHWGPVQSRHCIDTAGALERSYARLSN